jgi:DNA invertase Pin-like site-specific DNA recombinase
MATLAYIRVSTDKQDLDNQRHGVIEYAKRNGLEPLSFFEDTASGKKSWKERDLGKLINQANNGDVLLVSEISRLARSTIQVLEILQEAAARGLAVHIAKSNMIMDGSLNSRITATVLGLAAEIEREFISTRTTEALAKRKAAGLPMGRPRGAMSEEKKLDKKRDEVIGYLRKGVSKVAIATLTGVSRNTVYKWIADNGLEKYIKSDKPIKPKAKK